MATYTSDVVSGNQSFKPFPAGKVDDLDTGTALVLDVGDGADTDRIIDGSTSGQAGGVDKEDAAFAPHTYTADDTIDILVQVAPGGGGTGTIELWVYVS